VIKEVWGFKKVRPFFQAHRPSSSPFFLVFYLYAPSFWRTRDAQFSLSDLVSTSLSTVCSFSRPLTPFVFVPSAGWPFYGHLCSFCRRLTGRPTVVFLRSECRTVSDSLDSSLACRHSPRLNYNPRRIFPCYCIVGKSEISFGTEIFYVSYNALLCVPNAPPVLHIPYFTGIFTHLFCEIRINPSPLDVPLLSAFRPPRCSGGTEPVHSLVR